MDYIAYQHQQNHYYLVLLAESVGYSLAVISVPGLWSLIKLSVKSKVIPNVSLLVVAVIFLCYFDNFGPIWMVEKIDCAEDYIGEGEKKAPNQVAGEILSFFTRNDFAVTDGGEIIT